MSLGWAFESFGLALRGVKVRNGAVGVLCCMIVCV